MSYISHPEPAPPGDDPLSIILEELRDIFSVMEKLSLRLRMLETQQSDDQEQP